MFSAAAALAVWFIVIIIIFLILKHVWCHTSHASAFLWSAIIAFIVVLVIAGVVNNNSTLTDEQKKMYTALVSLALLVVVLAAIWFFLERVFSNQTQTHRHAGFIKDTVSLDCETGKEVLLKRVVSDGCQTKKTKFVQPEHHHKDKEHAAKVASEGQMSAQWSDMSKTMSSVAKSS